MTWTLALQHGDLSLGPASLGTVTGSAKLLQDLRCFLLEQMGTDDLHPTFGSLIDGGVENGQYVPGVIGQTHGPFATAAVQSEIRRMVAGYQARQLARARSDQAIYGKATLSLGEVLVSLSRVEVEQLQTRMTVTLFLVTGAADALTLTLGLDT